MNDKIKSSGKITFEIALVLNESEARALEALTGYDIKDFIQTFYEHLGRNYLEPHETGLRSLFSTIRTELNTHLKRADKAREAFKV